MQIQIQAQDFPLTEALVDYVEGSVQFVLSSRYPSIRRIAVHLSAVRAERGRMDKRCRVQVSLPHLRDILIDTRERDLYLAIDRAVQRAGQTVGRRLKRQRVNRRSLFVPYKARSLMLTGH